MICEFYVAGKELFEILDYIDFDINVLYSSPTLSKVNLKNRCKYIKKVFCDSAAYYMFSRYGKYPFTVDQYVEFVTNCDFDYVATMDVPCEGIDHQTKMLNIPNRDRIKMTIDNTIELIDRIDNLVSIVQGYELDEYLYCLDLMKDHGLLTDIVAIGSLCIRKRVNEIKHIIKVLRDNISKKHKIHAFGLSLHAIKSLEVCRCIDSFDSASWTLPSTHGMCLLYMPFTHKLLLMKPHSTIRRRDYRIIRRKELAYITLKNYICYINNTLKKHCEVME